MIEKLISIKNIGHFIDYSINPKKDNWDGQLKKINIIYAPNGSGKTTMATILRSLKDKSLLLSHYKHTFNSSKSVYLKILIDNQLYEYNDDNWNKSLEEIDVFDINFIEDYLFMGSISRAKNKEKLFELNLGEKGIVFKKEIKKLLRNSNTNKRKHIILASEKKELEEKINEFNEYSRVKYTDFINAVNFYLSKFTYYIRLTSIEHSEETKYEMFKIFLVFDVYGEKVKFCSPSPAEKAATAKYALSEGDKSTIALCIFLSRFKQLEKKDRIVVFDDPLSSFDSARKTATITQLSQIANDSKQFFLLTHDMNFAYEFYEKMLFEKSQIALQIISSNKGNRLSYFDIQNEIFNKRRKNLIILNNYKNGDSSEDSINVVRSIRSALEDIIKIKYFDEIPQNIWLGQIIDKITDSLTTQRIHNLLKIKDNLIQLNDYTKAFHHGLGFASDCTIDELELRTNVNLFFETLSLI